MSAADREHLKLFGGRAGLNLAQAMCESMDILLGQGRTELFPDNVELHRSVADSKRLNELKGPRVIISSSGMPT